MLHTSASLSSLDLETCFVVIVRLEGGLPCGYIGFGAICPGTTQPDARRLVVVLERCCIVHALETLELLRTIETAPNPKVPHSSCDMRYTCSHYTRGRSCKPVTSMTEPVLC
jgi:hypothetical protein